MQGIFYGFYLNLVLTSLCSASKQPNLQPEKNIVDDDDVYRAEGHTSVDISVKHSWQKMYLKILMRETFLDFFNIEVFLPKLQLWLLMVDFLRY